MKYLFKIIFTFLCLFLSIQSFAQPIATPDTIGVCNNDSVHINVLANDFGDGLVLDDILVEPEFGSANEVDDLFIRYKPEEGFIGTEVLIYSVMDADELFDIANVTIYVMDSNSCVWPGDANHDKLANNLDILNVGLYYGDEGPARFETDDDWDGDYCDAWDEELALELTSSPKHADCNGDGIVNAADTIPIVFNYGESYFKGNDVSGGEGDPPFYIDFFTDTILAGANVSLPLKLGTIDIPATNVYGLAFTISGGDGIIVPGSLRVSFNSGWMGVSGADLISLNYYDSSEHSYDVGVSRINHLSATGYGSIGTIQFVMEDDLAGKNDVLSAELILCLNSTTPINDFGQILAVNALCDTVTVFQPSTAIYDKEISSFKIFPNPANNYCTIQLAENFTGNISVKNLFGQEIIQQSFNHQNTIELSTEVLSSGTYILEIQSDKKIIQQQKLVIQK